MTTTTYLRQIVDEFVRGERDFRSLHQNFMPVWAATPVSSEEGNAGWDEIFELIYMGGDPVRADEEKDGVIGSDELRRRLIKVLASMR